MHDFLVSNFGFYAKKQREIEVRVLFSAFTESNLYFRMPKVASATITKTVSSDIAVLSRCYRPGYIKLNSTRWGGSRHSSAPHCAKRRRMRSVTNALLGGKSASTFREMT